MKLHQLRIFESVARHLNVTTAADELNMSQPAVSLQLKMLEQEYGIKFYDRNNRGMELTAKGRAFLESIRPVLAQIEKIEIEFKARTRSKKSEVLIIGANHTTAVTALPEILLNYKKHHPDVELVLETADSATIESWIESFKLDIALINSPSYLPNCEYEPYEEQEHETVAFVPPTNRLSEQTMSLEELAKHPLVVRSESTVTRELKKRGYKLNLALQCHAPDAVKMAVQKGLGVGLMFRSWVQPEIDRGDVRAINVPELKNITSKSFIVHDRRKFLSSGARDFLNVLRAMRASAQEKPPNRVTAP